jgi:triphosphoribosyl-dephospho-CoA synthase
MAALACLWEVACPKPGNVHRGADFENLSLFDFLASAVAITPAMDQASEQPLGQTVLRAARATRDLVGTNTNLGTILLLAPLASVPLGRDLQTGVKELAEHSTIEDAVSVYEAIRLAQPGGLGEVAQADIQHTPELPLHAAMALAADRDSVARQYVTGFGDIFQGILPDLEAGLGRGWTIPEAVIDAHVRQMTRQPDSLIARKCGLDVARDAARRASYVVAAGGPENSDYHAALGDLDFWLRSDGHRRNPGTTADLIAASLFAALRLGIIQPPYPCRFDQVPARLSSD